MMEDSRYKGMEFEPDLLIRMWDDYIDILQKRNKNYTQIQISTIKEYIRYFILQMYSVMIFKEEHDKLSLYIGIKDLRSGQHMEKYIFDTNGEYVVENVKP